MARCPGCGKYQLGPVVDNHVCNPPIKEPILLTSDCHIRISELEQENARLRKALGEIVSVRYDSLSGGLAQCQKISQQALKE